MKIHSKNIHNEWFLMLRRHTLLYIKNNLINIICNIQVYKNLHNAEKLLQMFSVTGNSLILSVFGILSPFTVSTQKKNRSFL